MRRNIFYLIIFVNQLVLGQVYFPTNTGVKTEEDTYKAITNVKIHSNSNEIIESNSILIHKGKIVAIGKNIPIPKNARIYNMQSLHIYPSFIELHNDFGIKKPKRIQSSGRSAEYSPKRKGYYWNDHILSDYNSIKDYNYNKDLATKMRKIGFGVVNSHRKNGIHRGEDLYENDGFIVHFFSKDKVNELSNGFKVLDIEKFEEGKFPRKLFIVKNIKL